MQKTVSSCKQTFTLFRHSSPVSTYFTVLYVFSQRITIKYLEKFKSFSLLSEKYFQFVGSMLEWLERRGCDQHGLGSIPTPFILLSP